MCKKSDGRKFLEKQLKNLERHQMKRLSIKYILHHRRTMRSNRETMRGHNVNNQRQLINPEKKLMNKETAVAS
jgi:hypothetical protein